MLDEPTNHLDLDSIAAIEAALADFDGALLVASHDEDFLAAIGIDRRLDFPLAGDAMTVAAALLAWYDRHARKLPWRVGPKERARGVDARPLPGVAVGDHAAADDGRGGEALFRRLRRAAGRTSRRSPRRRATR